uniref:C-type lectin domain-containing protein n=1 Tax=Astatotilapia calliptera TaxID=8154 RepID=A0A3P8QQA7_ASTCA
MADSWCRKPPPLFKDVRSVIFNFLSSLNTFIVNCPIRNWAKNEPNNGGSRHGEEDCVHIRAADQRTWNDISCTASMKWICKKIP